MNEKDSIAGIQADYFAAKVAEYSKGTVRIEVHPASLLGTLDEQLAQVQTGVVALHHNTAAAFGTFLEDFAVLDSPYAYRDVHHLLRVTDPTSPIMRKLGEELLKNKGLRVLYSYYFGTRQLTCDRAVYRPEDLAGVKIRAIPYPMYVTAVEGMGAVAVPIDWSRTPTALAAKAVNGQENPINTILTSHLYESQKYLMLTDHIRSAHIVVMNDAAWRRLSKAGREALSRAARDASVYGTELLLSQERQDLAALIEHGMIVIGPKEGLDIAEFRKRVLQLRTERFGRRWADYDRLIDETK
jgi:tripartite ATP-independent transporter DctP family solute receptor